MNVLVTCKDLLLLESLINSLSNRLSDHVFYSSTELNTHSDNVQLKKINLFILDIETVSLKSLRALQNIFPQSKIIILSSRLDREYVTICRKFGINGYFTKRIDIESLVDAVSIVTQSSLFICTEWFSLSPSISDDELNNLISGTQDLSAREIDTLNYTIEGYNSNEIAVKMNVEKKSVDNYKHRINKKINPTKSSTFSNFILRNKELIIFLIES